MVQDTTLLYFVKNGQPCGHYTYPYPLNHIEQVNELSRTSVSIFPNPATSELTIKTNNAIPCIITLANMMGQIVTTLHTNKQLETINTSAIPAGVYNISITDESGSRYNDKVVIVH